jgi:hypothetical protein
LPRRSIGAEADHPIVTAELHRSCTVSAPVFDFTFHYLLPLNHLQNRLPKMVQFQACRAEALGEGGLTLPPPALKTRALPQALSAVARFGLPETDCAGFSSASYFP